MKKECFGKTIKGEKATLYTLENKNGLCVKICDFGGAIQSIVVPTAKGLVDVVLGYEDVSGYEAQDTYIGSLVGRVCNRIAGGTFSLNGKEYKLFCNDKSNHLHGGKVGFDKKLWRVDFAQGQRLGLFLNSPHLEEGYPGNLSVQVIYDLSDADELSISYHAVSDADTLCNLTNHTYFNLDGALSGVAGEQRVQIFADSFTPTDKEAIPLGELRSVANTPFDLRQPQKLLDGWDLPDEQIQIGRGYDHNYALPEYDGKLKHAARAWAAKSGIQLDVYTNLPGLQFYSGNYLGQSALCGKGNKPFKRRSGYCFESQYFPNAINEPSFAKPILRAGSAYEAQTVYKFSY